MVVRPKALLFDFGGVLADSPGARPDRVPTLVARVAELIGGEVSDAQIAADVTAGRRAYSQWRDALARTPDPEELTHARFWADFVAADWPAAARATVTAHATELVRIWIDRGFAWELRPGVRESLELAHAAGVPAAVVSNTLCGAPMREFLEREGLSGYFAAQLYSDEVGIRKPNPRFALLALDALGGVPANAAWFMDDQLSRGILCARRAGVATAIHVYDGSREPLQPPPSVAVPDVTVASMTEFRALLAGQLGS